MEEEALGLRLGSLRLKSGKGARKEALDEIRW
ncbi:hypothetical protein COLO4_33205 [Corchorus olitorius]|uniref:Uncharacterized protein n=1 Tax=Corchorus olitorius TaxID=93759 RepID=A0A1R3GVN5_9ROSI|nr:hypothetical protein COLO4_33205 [Corchorus olitorius]